jgi:hypothetical protein
VSRLRSAVALALLVAGFAILAIGILAGPPRINIRWSPETTTQSRSSAERSLELTGGRPEGGRTWSYDVRDSSRAHIERIVRHPAVEDTAAIARDLMTLRPDAPPVQAWLQSRFERPPVHWIAAFWWIGGPALCVLGLVVASPTLSALTSTGDWRVGAVIVLAAGLRVSLIVSGGQYYWPDERQYREAQHLVATIAAGDPAWIREFLTAPSAVVLKLTALAPATVERLIGENPRVPALFFGCCSLVVIWLSAAIARRLDATSDEAFLAALFAGGSTTLFYMSRHLLSYDLALMCGLCGMFTGVKRPGTAGTSVLTGMWSVAAFLAYAGAWTLAGAVCAIHLADARTLRDVARRAAVVLLGIAAVFAGFAIVYHAAGLSWLQRMVEFAGTVRQGEFDEGWRLPIEYLWHTEHLLLAVWLAAIAWCIVHPRWAVTTRAARAGLVGVGCIYAALALTSTVLHQFVVYGRLSRPLVPFLCLVTAAALGPVLVRVPRTRITMLVAVTAFIAVQAGFNFQIPLRQQFPAEFIADIERHYAEPRLFVNAKHLYPGPEPIAIPAGFREVASAGHPLAFRPYQYEGYAEGERRGLRLSDLRMRAYVGSTVP